MLLVDEKKEMTLVHKLTLVAVNENTENTSCTRKQNSTLHAALKNKYFFMLLVNTKKIVLLTNDFYLIKCCWWMKKMKLIRD